MPDVSCPSCSTTGEPAARERDVAICVNCGVTLAIDGTTARVAGFDDLKLFSNDELQRLRVAHSAIVRPGKAR